MSAFRRALTLAAFATSLFSADARAQIVGATGLSNFVKDYRVDFAIPDAPAFKLLDVSETAILRPQTLRTISAAFDGFRGSTGSFVVPKQVGVEFSPALIIGDRYATLSGYEAQRFLYATHISVATNKDSANRSQLGAGIRFSIKDERDMARLKAAGTDSVVTRFTTAMVAVYSAARNRSGPPPRPIVLNAEEKQLLQILSDSIKGYWADHYWNARSIDVAFGGRTTTSDSLGRDPKFDQFAAWLTYSERLSSWGQLLFGGKFGTARDSTGSFSASNALALRLYIGANSIKAFVEGQRALQFTLDGVWLGNGGVEVRVPNFGWLNATAGVASAPTGGRPRLLSSFKFKTGIPGLQ